MSNANRSSSSRKIRIHEMALRDGMHPKRHQITTDEMATIAVALDKAGMPLIEVTHGDGLAGSSINYGFGLHTDEEYLRAVCPKMENAVISALTLPGIGTVEDLEMAVEAGVGCLRVATHCTEADVSIQHIGMSRKLGVDTVGFLMMAHMLEPDALVEQAKIMAEFGAHCVYVTDSAGFLLPDGVRSRVGALREALDDTIEVGFHGHHNMSMGVANSLAAIEVGAARIDSACAGLGAGAGNTPTEVLVACCHRLGIETGIDLWGAMDVAEDLVTPLMDEPVRVSRDALVLGYAGVYSSFLLFAQRAGAKYGIPSRDILVEAGLRKTVGGQEDMIEDIALDLSRARSASSS